MLIIDVCLKHLLKIYCVGLSMTSSIDKIVRKGGRICNFCGNSPSDPKIFLKSCSGCNGCYYCDAECQKKHWKTHKASCRLSQTGKQEIVAQLGQSFSDYADKWRRQHHEMITSLGSILVTSLNKDSHALVIFADYDTNSGRGKKALIQVERAESVPLIQLYFQYAGLQSGFETMINNTNDNTGSDFYRVVCIIFNRDEPSKDPLAKLSYLGHPQNDKSRLSVTQIFAVINKGSYEN